MKRNFLAVGAVLFSCLLMGSWIGSVGAQNSLAAPEKELVIDGRKPARFSHPVHLELGLECGVCHHDQEHNPLNSASIAALDDPAGLKCTSCHNSEHPDKELRRAKDVFHARCKTCHQEGYEGKNGPTKCSACHLKKKRALEGC